MELSLLWVGWGGERGRSVQSCWYLKDGLLLRVSSLSSGLIWESPLYSQVFPPSHVTMYIPILCSTIIMYYRISNILKDFKLHSLCAFKELNPMLILIYMYIDIYQYIYKNKCTYLYPAHPHAHSVHPICLFIMPILSLLSVLPTLPILSI